jgi:hypothetical protein
MACTHDLRVMFLRGLLEMLLEMAWVTVEWESLYEKTDEADGLKNSGAMVLTKINQQNTLVVENRTPSSFLSTPSDSYYSSSIYMYLDIF